MAVLAPGLGCRRAGHRSLWVLVLPLGRLVRPHPRQAPVQEPLALPVEWLRSRLRPPPLRRPAPRRPVLKAGDHVVPAPAPHRRRVRAPPGPRVRPRARSSPLVNSPPVPPAEDRLWRPDRGQRAPPRPVRAWDRPPSPRRPMAARLDRAGVPRLWADLPDLLQVPPAVPAGADQTRPRVRARWARVRVAATRPLAPGPLPRTPQVLLAPPTELLLQVRRGPVLRARTRVSRARRRLPEPPRLRPRPGRGPRSLTVPQRRTRPRSRSMVPRPPWPVALRRRPSRVRVTVQRAVRPAATPVRRPPVRSVEPRPA